MNKWHILVLLVLSLLLGVTISQGATTTRDPPTGDALFHLEGYSRQMSKWTRGELKGWLEDNWVPYRLQMASIVAGDFEITIQHDHEWTGSGGPDPGVDMCRSTPGEPLYGKQLFLDTPTQENFWIGNATGTNTGIEVTTVQIADLIEPNTVVIQYKSSFAIPSTYAGKTLYLYWMAHLAIGSSGWSGASLHAHTTATGKQDVPIAIPPNNKIFGYKFYDANRNGKMEAGESGIADWTIYAEGLYLGSPLKLKKKTDTAGYYEFSGLPDGTWTLTEEHKSGWIETTASPYTVSVKRGQTKGPYNFGNFEVISAIDVTKTGPTIARRGDTITYTIIVTNTGNSPLSGVTVTDTLLGTIDGTFSLAKGESKTFNKDYTIPNDAPDPLPNTVTAKGYDELGKLVQDSASWSVDLIITGIDVDKTGPYLAHEGDTITYRITVKNTGTTKLFSVTVTDTLLGTVYSGELNIGQEETVSKTYTIPTGAPDPLPNTVTAKGTDELGFTVTDKASWNVDILHPKISIEKSGPTKAHEGDTVTYTIKVSNTGDCALYKVSVSDPMLGPIYNDGLALGESKTFNKDYTIPSGASDPLINTVTASGEDILGKKVSSTDSWSVDILHPQIEIVKTATPDTIQPGETVTYEYKVTNIGDCILYNVGVTDNKLGAIGTILSLGIGESQTLTSSAQPSEDTTNLGTATGKDELGKEVSDSDDAFVHVTTPPPPKNPPSFDLKCITLVEWVQVGGTKTMTMVVTNTGVPQSRIYYLTFTAVIGDYNLLKFVEPYTAHVKVYYNDGSTWETDVSGTLTQEKFSGFDILGDYWMVTWRVPTTYPDGPYLEGNYQGYLDAKAEISFEVAGVAPGSTWLVFFPRATEDHHSAGVPLGSVADKANIWESDGFWYPVHNSYDPYDADIGHAFVDLSWATLSTTYQYARAIRFIDIVT